MAWRSKATGKRLAPIAKLAGVMLVAAALGGLPHGQSQGAAKPAAARMPAKAERCVACHGTPQSPPPPGMPALAGQQAEFLGLQMFLIREKLRHVPEMDGIMDDVTDAELGALADYFAKQPRLKVAGKPDAERRARGAALSKKLGCGSCHMPDYSGQRQVPRLTGQPEDYLAAALKAYRDGKRSGSDTTMSAVMYGVPDGDILALAHYLSRL